MTTGKSVRHKVGSEELTMKLHHSPFSSRFAQATSVCMLAFVTASGLAYADLTPTTGVEVQTLTWSTDGTLQDQQSVTNPNAPSSASVSRTTVGGDGSTGGASATAIANFGTLGVSGSGGGSTPPATPRAGGGGSALASAFWDDFLTAVPNPDSLLVPGAPVTANLALSLDFQNSTLALNNANGFFDYELSAGIVVTDPVTGVQSSITLLDDCFVFNDPDFNLCGRGSHRIDIPGNTGDQPLAVQFAPITLPLAIGQPFELGVGLSYFGECNVGPSDTAISSCSFDNDAMHTSTATLQPLGDFTLVAASGHDYSAPVTTPPGSLPEPGSLALVVSGLLPAALSLRRRSNPRKR
jgi:hypothetical protein